MQTGSLEELLDTIEAFREGSKTNPPEDFDGVCLMSFHGSKGLEFKRVYLTDCNEEITPYKKAVEKEEIEEERRMFYVAATRAKDELYLCFLERMYNKKLAVSRFVEEFANEKKTDAT